MIQCFDRIKNKTSRENSGREWKGDSMNYQQKLLSKNGLSTMILAKELIGYKVGERIPTVSELNKKIGIARGTIQNAMSFLQSYQAIELESKGHLGSFLVAKNNEILLSFAGITSIVGAMPLPYSRRYEGLAAGLIMAMQNKYDIPVSMAYMRGAENRITMLLSGRYDFAVVSKYAANEIMKEKNRGEIEIMKEFGAFSYTSRHVVLFHNPAFQEISDGMKVAIDDTSIDQSLMTKKICIDKKVEFVEVGYHQILEKIRDGSVDAAIWSEDMITDKMLPIHYVPLNGMNNENTEAVVVVNIKKPEIKSLIYDILNVEDVLKVQKLVLEGKMIPSY